jgi:hypothetical protein
MANGKKPKFTKVATPITQTYQYGKPLKGVRGPGTPHKASARPQGTVKTSLGKSIRPPYGGGDLPQMTPRTSRGEGTMQAVKAAGKAATAVSKGTMAGKAASWLKNQGFVPSYK